MSRILQPADWVRPRGFSNGIVASGRYVAIAGQIGWNERAEFVSDDFLAQSAQALRNIVTILAEAGATPAHIVRMTWYVTDKDEYMAGGRELGALYKDIIGAHYPAMTLIVVKALLEDRAKVEIEATAVIPE
ncbi:MAG: RidA family protein [Candidatus Eremiobacteraeota bacterium]|nr:RidA family protein [Candidatus Eremiobacteraeota bacterium]